MKTRIISGAVAIVLLVGLTALHSTVIFNIGFAVIGALAVFELFRAEKLEKEEYLYLTVSELFALECPISVYLLPDVESGEVLMTILAQYILSTFAYIVIATIILLFRHKFLPTGKFYVCAGYTALIAFCMTSLCGIVRASGSLAVLCLVFTYMGSWVADSGAYFAGTFFGKHKLCPEISPKKTVEGLIGGAVTNALAFSIFAFAVNKISGEIVFDPFIYAVLGVICCFLGLIGDLTASLIKRECGVKDYGNIMPGHGGALDRFDSVIYVAPFMLIVFCSIG